jgi:hypothetical protein
VENEEVGIKDLIHSRLYEDLIGPLDPLDCGLLNSNPSDVYLTGILFPTGAIISEEEEERLSSEGASESENSGTDDDQTSLSSAKRPSSIGLSVALSSEDEHPKIEISIQTAFYRQETIEVAEKEGPFIETEEKDEITKKQIRKAWRRTPLIPPIFALKLDKSPIEKVIDDDAGLGIYVKSKRWKNNWLVTVALVNNKKLSQEYEIIEREESSLFQSSFSIRCASGTKFIPRPQRASAQDEDTKLSALLYRNAAEYAAGHTCSAAWDVSSEDLKIETKWLPKQVVKAISPEGDAQIKALSQQGTIFNTRWLSENKDHQLISELKQLPAAYDSWLEDQKSLTQDIEIHELKQVADENLRKAKAVSHRISKAIRILEADNNVQLAFRLANLAINTQSRWASRERNGDLNWRPFQLAFILLSLESVAEERHPDRQIVDLLWFPTGGGKTEAYLGLIAFTIFLRRIRFGEAGGGVTAFMRYTLRLLTTQQFQRASTLICACEAIRKGAVTLPNVVLELPGPPIAIGLWVGGDATPNKVADAAKMLPLHDSPPGNSPAQLDYCPWHRASKLEWIKTASNQIRAFCEEPSCLWYKDKSPLPVLTVDEDIYAECPALLIGTVDKFAQIVRNENTTSMFGINTPFRAPDLIIQDELHLISGPLGTLVGIYEMAIDQLCSRGEIRPKVIASTATIRQASEQIKSLFNRDTCMFPHPIINAANSGFAVEVDHRSTVGLPGRLYLGVSTAGRSAKFTLQAIAASLLQSATSDQIDESDKDYFWTLVSYFNSLRELGGALVLMQDDVPKSISAIADRRDETARKTKEPLELTSRVTQEQIKGILEELDQVASSGSATDAVLASSMMSVGVDVPRLGAMIVMGQPKGVSEYIQATSRVGRNTNGPGGLVISIYNNAKARDRSFFESFQTSHQTLYKQVEATSVTPFADRARQKALHAVLVAIVRHKIPDLKNKPNLINDHRNEVDGILDSIKRWVKEVDSSEAIAAAMELDEFIDDWRHDARAITTYWHKDHRPNSSIDSSLLISAERAAELAARFGFYSYQAKPTPNSMRNVEAATAFELKTLKTQRTGRLGRRRNA